MSHMEVSRIERADLPGVSIVQLARLLSVVGLELSARAYPAGLPLRDAAHLKLLARLEALLGAGVRMRREVVLQGDGGLRAWDAVIHGAGAPIAVEAETRLRDLQSLFRRIALKQRDGQVERVILLVAATTNNRRVLREFDSALRGEFPLGTRSVAAALRAGVDPGGSGVLVL
jgi:hypothetical protein